MFNNREGRQKGAKNKEYFLLGHYQDNPEILIDYLLKEAIRAVQEADFAGKLSGSKIEKSGIKCG